MRITLIETLKIEIEVQLKNYLREEGVDLYVAANDNILFNDASFVTLDAIEDSPLAGQSLLHEIKVRLSVLGTPKQCETLVKGMYAALHPHHITPRELMILLMSIHVETLHCVIPMRQKKYAVMRYILEKAPHSAVQHEDDKKKYSIKTEYC